MGRYLEGEPIRPINAKTMRALEGQNIVYLRGVDLDQSGRGFFFPRHGTVGEVRGREFWNGGDWVRMSDVIEMVLRPDPESEATP